MTTIKLISKDSRIIIKQSNSNIRLSQVNQNIRFKASGPRGLQGEKGEQGEPGVGVPPGGLTGQVLTKASDNDYDFVYSYAAGGGDKNYEQSFTVASFVAVNHNLNKYPSPIIRDSAGDEVEGTVVHIDKNSLTVTFSAPFSGIVSCN